jgi:hypothetical protein
LLLTCTRSLAMTAVLGTACSSPARPDAGANTCTVGFLGDEAGAPDFDIQVLLADDTVANVQDGGSVPLLLPPQGGRVIFVGVRATGVDGCALQLTGALRDLASGKVSVDKRTINLIPTGDGWGASCMASRTDSRSRSSTARSGSSRRKSRSPPCAASPRTLQSACAFARRDTSSVNRAAMRGMNDRPNARFHSSRRHGMQQCGAARRTESVARRSAGTAASASERMGNGAR